MSAYLLLIYILCILFLVLVCSCLPPLVLMTQNIYILFVSMNADGVVLLNDCGINNNMTP